MSFTYLNDRVGRRTAWLVYLHRHYGRLVHRFKFGLRLVFFLFLLGYLCICAIFWSTLAPGRAGRSLT